MRKFLWTLSFVCFAAPASAELTARNNTVIDAENGLLWYRCTIGMRFDPVKETCVGSPHALSQDQIPAVIRQANDQLGGKWRLPNKNEIRSKKFISRT